MTVNRAYANRRMVLLQVVGLALIAGVGLAQSTPTEDAFDDALVAAIQAADAGDTKAAMQFASRAVKLEPDRYEPYLLVAEFCAQAGRHAPAAEAFKAARDRAPPEAKAAIAEFERKYMDAVPEVQYAIRLEAGLAAIEGNRPRLAAENLVGAWILRPEEWGLAVEASRALLAIEEFGEAVELLTLVQSLLEREDEAVRDPVNAEVSNLLAAAIPLRDAEYERRFQIASRELDRLPRGDQSDPSLIQQAARLVALDRRRGEGYILRAKLLIRASRPLDALESVQDAVAFGWVNRRALATDPDLRELRELPEYRRLVEDVAGKATIVELDTGTPGSGAQDPARFENSLEMQMIRVEPATFTMGEPGSTEPALRAHRVEMSRPYYMAQTEVTQEQWESLMATRPSPRQGDALPVHGVSWFDAMEFCEALSNKEGRVYRLPTEAEWELACRAGGPLAYGDSDDPDVLLRRAVFAGARPTPQGPAPVGSRNENAWGFQDLEGNVFEWCFDRFGPYGRSPSVDPTGPTNGDRRAVRGGSWQRKADLCRSFSRIRLLPTQPIHDVGFRIVCEVGDLPFAPRDDTRVGGDGP